jgi:hypothetical protein
MDKNTENSFKKILSDHFGGASGGGTVDDGKIFFSTFLFFEFNKDFS